MSKKKSKVIKETPEKIGGKTGEKTPLFREEAIRHRTRALFGDVVLAAPISTWIITTLLVMTIVGLVVFGIFGKVQIDNENIQIWRWILGINQ